MSLTPGAVIGKYTVRRKLAEGGMAELFLCAAAGPEGFKKDVVIKRVRPQLASDPAFVEMFVSEARLASRLNHRNLIHIFDFDRHEDTYYLAMEYVRGASLWELRRRCKAQGVAIPPVLAAHIGAEVARGLAYAHRLSERGEPLDLVHRDVTPHNVLLSFEGEVKLTDFGIARAGSGSTVPGVLKGKFAYMSPEQARGEAVDARTDIFALGVVLWEMLTGGRLFEGDGDIAVLRAVQRREIPPPARLNPDVPEALDAVVMRALERDLGQRMASASELERALSEVVLRHARSVDDTDVGAFLRRVLKPEETAVTPTPASVGEPASEAVSVELSGVAPGEPPAQAPRAEPTAVMPGRRPTPRRLPAVEVPVEPPLGTGSLAGTTQVLSPSGGGNHVGPGDAPALAPGGGAVPPSGTAGRRLRAVPLWAAGAAGLLALSLFVARHGGAFAEGEGSAASPAPAPEPTHVGPPSSGAVAPEGAPARPESPAAPHVDAAPSAPMPVPPSATGPSPATDSAPREAEASPTKEDSPRPETAIAMGELRVRVFPWAKLEVDGRPRGSVQGERTLRLPVGRHRIRLSHPAHPAPLDRTVLISADFAVPIEWNPLAVR